MMYQTWLDLSYSSELNGDYIHDMEIEMRELKKHYRISLRFLKKAEECYEELYGRKPKRLK